ncbi:MAG: hypothetical protein MJ145_05025 [Clostridia bacterium]|nr:hypothetical protein [Clostridia bacterium]
MEKFVNCDPKWAYDHEDTITYEDKLEYAKAKALYQMAYEANLDKPETLNEKIIWLALNYKNPDISVASDKIKAKEYISSRIGEEYVAKLYGVYDSAQDIDFDSLPNSFVLKSNCAWAAKAVRLVNNKAKTDFLSLQEEAKEWLRPWMTYKYNNMCIGDENIEPRLLAEENLSPNGELIKDYKIFYYHGKAQFIYVVDDRDKENQTKTFLDLHWNILPCHRYDVPASKALEKPAKLEEMIRLGEKLSKDFPLVRVDFYYVNDRVYVGEMTFTPGMFLSIEPKEWDYKLGEGLNLDGLE